MPKIRDRITSSIASQVMKRMTRDERMVRVLIGTKPENVPNRLLLVATTYVMTKASSKLKKVKMSKL